MAVRLDINLVNQLYESSEGAVARIAHETVTSEPNRLKLDAGTIISVIAWQILIPFIVAFTSEVAAQKLIAKDIKQKSIQELKQIVYQRLGDEISIGNDDQFEECVILVQELLEPFQIDRSQAREVVILLRTHLEGQ